ncbi:MAG: ATP-binding protein, partial [Solirubrobacteraceae bacterium]
LGHHAEVVSDLEALVREQPYRERPHGQLMLALYRCGRQADALAAFRRVRQLLLEELAVEPSTQLRELEQRILRQDPELMTPVATRLTDSASVPEAVSGARDAVDRAAQSLPAPLRLTPRTPFVGREAEEHLTHEAVEEARHGTRRIIVIGGEPGVGKTRLAARAALEAHDLGFGTYWAAAAERVGAPYAIWLTALSELVEEAPRELVESVGRRYGGELARLVPWLGELAPEASRAHTSDPETERYLMFQAVIALLEAVSTVTSVALVLDDIHWADAPSLALLEHVAAATAHLPLFIAATFRESDLEAGHPLSDTLAALHRVDGVERVTLEGLTSNEVAELMAAIAGHDMGAAELELAAEIASETDGNPFFVVQILRHLQEHGEIAQDESGRWSVSGLRRLTLPPSIREVVAGRIHRLGDETEAILNVAAVIGQTFDIQVLARVMQRNEDDLLDPLEAAVRAVVLIESTERVGRFTFAHALFRRSLYDGVGATRRGSTHRLVAEAIEELGVAESGEHLNELAYHWIASGRSPRKAVAYAQRAGEHALAQLAPDHAVGWFEQALSVVGPDERDLATRCDLLIGLGEAKRQVGDASFRDCLLDASGVAERLDDTTRMTRAALANTLGPFGAAGPPDLQRIQALRRTLHRLPADGPHVALLRATLAKEVYYGGDPHGGVELGEQALALARQGSDRRELARVMSFTAAISPITPLEDHAARVRELAMLGDEFVDPDLQFRAANMGFIHAMHSGDREALNAALASMHTLADAIGQPVLRWTTLWAQSAHQWITGDLDAAERLTMQAAAVARAHNIPEGLLITFGQLLAVRSEQDRLEELVEPLERQLERNPRLRLLHLTHGYLAAETGRLAEAEAVLADLAADGFTFEFDRTRAFNLARCADIALRIGALDAAPALYEALSPHRAEFATPAGISSRGSVELNLGRLASALGRHDDAERHLEAATRAHAGFRAPLLEARALLAHGEALLARDDAKGANEALASAAALAHKHGSTAIEREVTRLLEALREPAPTHD